MSRQSSVVQFLSLQRDFKQLRSALKLTDLGGMLSESPSVTLFAPTDAAFLQLSLEEVRHTLANVQRLRDLVLNHVVAGAFDPDAIAGLNGTRLQTMAGHPVAVGAHAANEVTVNRRPVSEIAEVGNGFIYVIDRVLLPGGATRQLEARRKMAPVSAPNWVH